MSYTRGRTLWESAVTNEELQHVITETARESVRRVHWPRELDARDAPELLHAFVTQCTVYSAEDETQYVRTPAAFVRDMRGDCKSTAIFIGCLARSAGWPVVLRFVRYHGADHFGHVYAVVGGQAVDPLLPIGQEVVHLQSKDARL